MGKIITTPDEVRTRTITEVTDVTRKKLRADWTMIPTFLANQSEKLALSYLSSWDLLQFHISSLAALRTTPSR